MTPPAAGEACHARLRCDHHRHRPGRTILAFRLAGAGMKVAVVERHLVGGTCVNTGCTPTKALVASAYAARIARRAAEYGVVIGGDVGIDMRRVKARKDAIVAASRTGSPRPSKTPQTSRSTAATPGSRRRKWWKSPASGCMPDGSLSMSAAGRWCRQCPV